jgi:hypothetical protein
MRFDDFIKLDSLENAEVLDEIEDGLDLDQRAPSYISEATEFLRTATTDAFSEIEDYAIAGTTPLIRQVTFGVRESIDERARQYGKPPRMLVSLEVFENHD